MRAPLSGASSASRTYCAVANWFAATLSASSVAASGCPARLPLMAVTLAVTRSALNATSSPTVLV
ncbi:MAG: hypothetical protein LC624_10550 [Halobacteriales archaeon]|nr:hypothetical protein [Halobacteriales archaeon]